MSASVRTIDNRVKLLIGLVIGYGLAVNIIRLLGIISNQIVIYIVAPMLALTIAVISRRISYKRQDHIKHRKQRANTVLSVMVVWFVLYMVSGLIFGYTKNPLATDYKSVILNLISFSITALSLEYTRYSIFKYCKKIYSKPFIIVTAIVFATATASWSSVFGAGSPSESLKIMFSTIMPQFASSLVLSYLALTSGLRSMIIYRTGLILAAVILPFIPKLDWYLSGLGFLMLAFVIFTTISNSLTSKTSQREFHDRHMIVSTNIAAIVLLIVQVLFMARVFVYAPAAVASNSMRPIFNRGAMVVIKKVSPQDVKIGDIIQYKILGKEIIHRVVKIDRSKTADNKLEFITKGDDNKSEDTPVGSDQVIGVVKAYLPLVGYPSVWLNESILQK